MGARSNHVEAGAAVPRYRELAPLYDRLIGDTLFPAIRTSFESCRRTLGIRFSAAADIGCGSGRFLHHLSRYRIPLFGVDASPEMLRVAARRLGPDKAVLLCQDMRRFRLPKSVDLITCNGDTLNYLLSREDLHHTLLCCGEQLNPGGYLIGDFLCGTPVAPAGEVRQQVVRLPGVVSKWQWRAAPYGRITEVGIQFIFRTPLGKRKSRETHRQRWYTEHEFLRQLSAAGLRDCRIWPMPVPGGAGPGGRWLKFLARRLPEATLH